MYERGWTVLMGTDPTARLDYQKPHRFKDENYTLSLVGKI